MPRHPAVAGQFYKSSPEALTKQVREFIVPHAIKTKAFGIVSPHAGLVYSGPVAGALYSQIEMPDTFVLIGPNHTGLGAPVSIMARGTWETPLGLVEIDEALAAAILSRSSPIHEDSLAHLREHSLEVQLPFIQYFKKEFKIVPIQMLDTRLDTCLEVGRAVAGAIQETNQKSETRSQKSESSNQGAEQKKRRTQNAEHRTPNSKLPLIVASSDMSHYEPADVAKERDFKAIRQIVELNPEGLFRTVKEHGITMCGCGPTVAMLVACKILGATKAELIKYTNSGDVSHDYEQVVGYAGIMVS
jgi:predicted class III extradiol MEMO1 family dioxygenase